MRSQHEIFAYWRIYGRTNLRRHDLVWPWLFHAPLQAGSTAGRQFVFLSRMLDLTLIIVHQTTRLVKRRMLHHACQLYPRFGAEYDDSRLAGIRATLRFPLSRLSLFPLHSPRSSELRSRRRRRRRVLPVVVDFITSDIRRNDLLDLICISACPVVVNVQRSAPRPARSVPSGPVHRIVRPPKSRTRGNQDLRLGHVTTRGLMSIGGQRSRDVPVFVGLLISGFHALPSVEMH